MSETQAVRFHNGDTSLKKTKKGGVVSKARSTLAKKKGSPLALWRKVCKEYLQKGGFVTLPKKGTKEHKIMRGMYDKELLQAGLM
jgi:hypothetical protein